MWPIHSAEQNYTCNFGRRDVYEQSCTISLNLDQGVFLRYNLSTGLAAHAFHIICANFVEGITKKKFCKNILNLGQWFRRLCYLNIFLIYSSGDT